MSKRDLLLQPCWRAEDLGQPLPGTPHAVSVALPRWEDVIAYEEKDPACIETLQAIYPRFGLNPLVARVAAKALSSYGAPTTSSAWPYPNHATAKRAKQHCDFNFPNEKTSILEISGLACLIASIEATPAAKAFWQHTGLGASSRQAAIALNEESAISIKAGERASTTLRIRLGKIYGCSPDSIQLHPSGMAALNSAIEAISNLHPSRPTLQIGFPYVDVLKLPQVIHKGGDLLLQTDPKLLKEELKHRKPAALIVELPSNPMLQCIDLPTISKLAHANDIPVIADDTIGSAINIDCLPYADLVFSSLTKSFAGRGDIMAGSLVVSPYSRWKEFLKEKTSRPLSLLSDPDAVALEEASRDVVERMPKLNAACSFLASKLAKHNSVAKVLHPDKCANFQTLMRPGAGYGCLLSIELVDGINKAKNFYNALKVSKGPSLGTNFTLVCPYVLLAHYKELNWAGACGIPSHLLRISVGLEDPDDLWKRFQEALDNI